MHREQIIDRQDTQEFVIKKRYIIFNFFNRFLQTINSIKNQQVLIFRWNSQVK